MNYFAHGRPFLSSPYLVAGTAVPDWLGVLDRRVRARSRAARRFLASRDQRVALLAAGIVQHHRDDDWFHRTRAFAELSWQFTAEIRDRLPRDDGLRPSFLGHILVELLLDAELIRRDPPQLDQYYRCLEALDPQLVNWVVDRVAGAPARRLAELIPRFSRERFLYDYADDAKLLFRLNNVMHRVRLPEIPETLCEWFPEARRRVARRCGELLTLAGEPGPAGQMRDVRQKE
jgi:hypothetical protein